MYSFIYLNFSNLFWMVLVLLRDKYAFKGEGIGSISLPPKEKWFKMTRGSTFLLTIFERHTTLILNLLAFLLTFSLTSGKIFSCYDINGKRCPYRQIFGIFLKFRRYFCRSFCIFFTILSYHEPQLQFTPLPLHKHTHILFSPLWHHSVQHKDFRNPTMAETLFKK